MMNTAANGFSDQERLTDVLASQKFITDTYNTFSNECATPAVREDFLNILNEEHQIQFEVFSEMQKRGWYQTLPAEQQKIQQAKTKFSSGARAQ